MKSKFLRAPFSVLTFASFFLLGSALPTLALTTIGTDITTNGSLTVSGNVNLNDSAATTLLLGSAADTVTIGGNISLSDAQWSIGATGIASFVSINGLAQTANADGFSLPVVQYHGPCIDWRQRHFNRDRATNVTLPTTGTLHIAWNRDTH